MPKSDSLLERALRDAELKYGPQVGALRGLRSQLAQAYSLERRVNAGNARGIVAAIDEAQPRVAAAFDQALGSVNAQRDALGVGPADPQAAAFTRRVGEAKGTALHELLLQKQRTAAGQVYANQSARSKYMADKRKVEDQILGLIGESGSFAASRRDELSDAEADRGLRARGLSETERHNRESESLGRSREQRQGSTRPPQVKWRSPADHARARDLIEEAVAQVRDLRQDTSSRAEIIALLIKGVPASKLPDGTPVPAIPKLPADFVRAASNIVFDKTLSRGDVARLHARGLRIRSLDYPTRKRDSTRSAAQLAATGRPSISSRPPTPLSG